MLLNRALEAARSLSLSEVLLRRRALACDERVPLVVIPPMLGTRLRDGGGRPLWGWTRNLFFGGPVGTAPGVRLDGPLEHLTLVPGLLGRDVHGGLLRFLQRVGGYRLAEDLAVLSYDWRLGVVAAAQRLAEIVDRLRGASDQRVDLVCCSSAGLAARYYLAYGGRDVLFDESPAPIGAGARAVRRVVYLGTPQRGTLQALDVLQNGFSLAPWIGRHYAADDAASCQISYDLLPHPDDPVAAGADGRDVPLDLYEPETWREWSLCSSAMPGLADKLERARRLHRALDRASRATDSFVIGARHAATRRRLLATTDGARKLWACCPDDCETELPFFGPGDGSITEESLRALPGLDPARVWTMKPRVHHDIPSDPAGHRLVLEALLATDRAIPPPGSGPAPIPLRGKRARSADDAGLDRG